MSTTLTRRPGPRRQPARDDLRVGNRPARAATPLRLRLRPQRLPPALRTNAAGRRSPSRGDADQAATNDDLISMRRTLYGVGLARGAWSRPCGRRPTAPAEAVYGASCTTSAGPGRGERLQLCRGRRCLGVHPELALVGVPRPALARQPRRALCRQGDLVREVFRPRTAAPVRPECWRGRREWSWRWPATSMRARASRNAHPRRRAGDAGLRR